MGKKKRLAREAEKAALSNAPTYEPWGVIVIRWLAIVAAFAVLLYPHGHATIIGFSKVVVFEMITAIILAVWLPLAWADRRYRPDWRNPIVIGASVFLAAIAVTVPMSVDSYHSFWSDVYRQTGLFNYVHYWIWFMALASTQRGWPAWRRIFAMWNVAALAVAVYGVFRWLGGNMAVRMESSLGNALYLAIYCILSLTIAAVLLARAKDTEGRIYYGGSMVALAGIAAMSGSRSVVLGLGVAVLTMTVILLAVKRRALREAKLPLVTLGIFLLAAGTWLLLRTDAVAPFTSKHMPAPIQRIVFLENAGVDRAVLGDVALQMFRERPAFGWGLDMFEHGFEAHYDPHGPTGLLQEPWYDRAHNQFLDFLAMAGAAGFAGYVALWLAILYAAIHLIRTKPESERLSYVIATSGLIGYAATIFYAFDLLGVLPLFWGLIAWLDSREPEPNEVPLDEPAYLTHAALVLALVFTVGEAAFVLRPFIDSTKIDTACRTVLQDPRGSLATAKATFNHTNFATPELRFRLVDCYARALNPKTDPEWRKDALEFLADQSDHAVALKPYDFKTRMINAFAYSTLGQVKPEALDRADEIVAEARGIQPNRYRTEMVAAQIEIDRGSDQAAKYYRKALDLCPTETERIHIKSLLLAQLALAGELTEALQIIEQGHQTNAAPVENPQAAEALEKIIPTSYEVPDAVIGWFKATAEMYPSPASLSAYYKVLRKDADANPAEIRAAYQAVQTAYPDLAKELGAPGE